MARHDDQMMLVRIIALLFSFAHLAESLVGLSAQRRSVVMRLLRPGEAVAREFLAGEAGGRSLRGLPSSMSPDDDGPEAATRLAACFRALAFALDAILMQLPCANAWLLQARKPARQDGRMPLHPRASTPVSILDTS
jgi:hypothetical protein